MSQLFTSGHPSIGDSASASNEHSGLISFKIDWFDLLAVQGTLKSLLQHHNSEASIFQHSAFFMIELPHLYMTTGKTTLLLLFCHSVVSDSVTPWTAACRASLSFSSLPCSSLLFPVLLLEFAQAYVHSVGDAIQPSHPSLSPSALNLSQQQGLFQRIRSLHQVAKILELQLQLQHQSFQ